MARTSHPWTKTSARRSAAVRAVINLLFAVLTRRRVAGLQNIPTEGACLLVFNHLSNVDTALLFTLIRRPDLTGLVAAEYQGNAFYRWIVEAAGGVWLRRGASDRAALGTALELLDAGWMVGIAPEGRRSPTHALIEGKRGVAFLATQANVPVVPVGITNTHRLGRALKRVRRLGITVQVGEPFLLPRLPGSNHRQELEACTDTIMCRIAALLPPDYRGRYANHPELSALLPEG